MVNKVKIEKATIEHAREMAPRMRAADVAEIWASNRLLPELALELAIAMSSEAWAGYVNDELICVFGVAPASILTGDGTPWMLGTDGIKHHNRKFLRLSRRIMRNMKRGYKTLMNYVDVRNDVSIKWLKYLGFKIHDPVPYGPDRLPFCRFEMEG